MSPDSFNIAPAKALLSALTHAKKPVAFLVGAPLSMPDDEGAPGVPGITEMLALARARVRPEDQQELDERLKRQSDAAGRYQAAMSFLQSWYSQDEVNEVVRQAVRRSRRVPDSKAGCSEQEIEEDADGWHLPAGTRDLGRLVMQDTKHWSGPILTTNFDPLLSVAIKRAGGTAVRKILDVDGSLGRHEVSDARARTVVHLHGYWLRSDTLHTPDQLQAQRPRLSASLKHLLQKHTLLVVAYGGWDDVFTKSLADIALDEQSDMEVLWAFFESEPLTIASRYSALLQKTADARLRSRFRLYGGINCHELFGQLLTRSTGAQATPPPPPSTKTASRPDTKSAGPSQPPVNSSSAPTASKAEQARHAPPSPPPSHSKSLDEEAPALAPPEKESSSTEQKPKPSGGRTGVSAGTGLLLVLGAAAYLNNNSPTESPAPKAPVSIGEEMAGTLAPNLQKPELEAIRTRNQVRLMPQVQTQASRMAPGTYGFMQPGSATDLRLASVSRKPEREALEVHRTPSGALLLVGYVGASAAQALSLGQPVKTTLAASLSSQRRQLVSIPFDRVRAVSFESFQG